jgi:hypothetical protein
LNTMDPKERRAHARHETTLELHGTSNQGEIVARMVATNLSAGGLYCTSTTDFPEMTRLGVRLMLACNGAVKPVDLEAVVVRREKVASLGAPRYELALFFTSVQPAARREVESYLDQQSAQSSIRS